MQKLFRFKYEPCNGTCYQYEDFLPKELMGMSKTARTLTVERMVKAHDYLCDNPEFSFGIDFDPDSKTFVAHFKTPKETNIFTSYSFYYAVKLVTYKVMNTEVPHMVDNCVYGDNGSEDLGKEILEYCENLVA